VLQIKEAAAGKRYLRALGRLRELLAHLPGAGSGAVERSGSPPRPARDGEGAEGLSHE
jgi:hypothetical protein